MNPEIRQKVEEVKSSFTVEAVPLIKSNKFSDAEIAELRSKSTAHPSHWNRQTPGSRVWSDEEIAEQVEIMLSTIIINRTDLEDRVSSLQKSLAYEDKGADEKVFKKALYGIVGWDKGLNPEFWASFGSAPSVTNGDDFYGDKLPPLRKKYGARGMNEIFGSKFSDGYHLVHDIAGAMNNFSKKWDEEKNRRDMKKKVFTSPYKDLADIEDNVVVKKIPDAAKDFYMDKTKDFDERVSVFSKYGFRQNYIHRPSDRDLHKIFQMFTEDDNMERHQVIDCADVVEWWIGVLENKHTKLDWTNPYHPDLVQTNRKYMPRKESGQRLYEFYMEKLFLEGIGSFEFDW